MKKILVCVPLLSLASCSLIEPGGDGEVIIHEVTKVLPEAAMQVSSGNLVGAAYTVAAAVGTGLLVWLRRRALNSAKGEFIGPKDA